jgi:hypothetical protein
MLPKTVLRAASASVLAALLCGCLGVGPTSIKANRVGYNLAINQTNDQELLLNIVRMHYRDTLYFTSVQSILASASVAGSLAANFNAGFTGSVLTSQSVGVGPAAISVTENPTIVYAPIEGEKFVRQMMTPMNPDTLMLLIESGWSMDRVFSLGLSQMSGLPNAPTASGPTPSYQPVFADFKKAVLLLRVLQREHNLNIERRGDGLECVIPNPQANRESASQLRQMLHIQPDLDHFRFVVGDAPLDGHIVSIKTRSLLATLNYLSQGVEAPQGDIAAGKVRTTGTAGRGDPHPLGAAAPARCQRGRVLPQPVVLYCRQRPRQQIDFPAVDPVDIAAFGAADHGLEHQLQRGTLSSRTVTALQ